MDETVLLNIPGVYKITCKGNNECYVGSTMWIKKRINEHLWRLRSKKHKNYIQNSYDKYGEETFEFCVLLYLEDATCKEELFSHEQYYIDTLDPKFNTCKIAGSTLGMKLSQDVKDRISNAHKGKKLSNEIYVKKRSARRKAREWHKIDTDFTVYTFGQTYRKMCVFMMTEFQSFTLE
jgi:group I intron endonuclease